MSSPGAIIIEGARQHNLRGIDVEIERGKISVITGVSGSGKSSLAFDTILREAQRRFFHTLSHYTRQYLDVGARPFLKKISGLSPAISLAQNETLPSKRATVGTMSDLAELFGVLFANYAEGRCPKHGITTSAQTIDDIATQIMEKTRGEIAAICIPLAEEKKGSFAAKLISMSEKGYLRVFIDGKITFLTPLPELAKEEKHTIKIIVDQIKINDTALERLKRSLETALHDGDGYVECFVQKNQQSFLLDSRSGYSIRGGCHICGFSWPRLDSRHFSINSLGKCRICHGLGGRIRDVGQEEEKNDHDEDDGENKAGFFGICEDCQGTGLDKKYRAIILQGKSPLDIHLLTIRGLIEYIDVLLSSGYSQNPALKRVAQEISGKLERISAVGLDYLSLSRRFLSLSGGERQRLKLASILTDSLRGVLYILDEPSQGLHPAEMDQLWRSLERLKNSGNTIIVVDHDEQLIKKADWIIDLGPGGGAKGGQLLARFRPEDAENFKNISATGRQLVRETSWPKTNGAKKSDNGYIQIFKPRLNNLKMDSVSFLKKAINVVTGPSGSGKTSLVLGTLQLNLSSQCMQQKGDGKREIINCSEILGTQEFESCTLIDRRPISRTSLSMPASYLGIFTEVRELFAKLPEAQVAGLTPRAFSLSASGGRCEECGGRGEVTLSMRFLADARISCPICQGKRYQDHVLTLEYMGLSLNDILELTMEEAFDIFKHHKKIAQKLTPALELGLGYLRLGQSTSTLSGGEAQRLKLVPFFAKAKVENHIFIVDEPTTGLHFEDVTKLIGVFRTLVNDGATIVIIEHNGDIIKNADWVVDLGPGSADKGGELIYQGEPRGLMGQKRSLTGQYL